MVLARWLRCRGASWLLLGVAAFSSSPVLAGPDAANPVRKVVVPTVQAEVAPGPLGSKRSKGQLALAAAGKFVYLYDGTASSLSGYAESGQPSGDPVKLEMAEFSPGGKPLWLGVGGSQVGVGTPSEIALFNLDGSRAGYRAIFGLSSLTALKNGDLAAGVLQLPGWAPSYSDSKDPEEPRPRVVSFTDKLEQESAGLRTDRKYTMNQGAARAVIVVSAPPHHVYAVEAANYRIYELENDLKLHSTLSLPKIQLENGGVDKSAQQSIAAREKKAQEEAAQAVANQTATIGPAPSAPQFESESFSYQLAVLAAGWDSSNGRLLILLDRGVAGPSLALDVVDPAEGRVSRLLLHLPGGSEAVPAQLAVGHDFVWIRSRLGSEATFRIPKESLEAAVSVGTLSTEQ